MSESVWAIVGYDDEYGFIESVYGVYATEAEAEADLSAARVDLSWRGWPMQPFVEEMPWSSEAAVVTPAI